MCAPHCSAPDEALLVDILRKNLLPVLVLATVGLLIFTVIGLGYLVGNIRIAGIEAGPVIGVPLVGLLFGHFGFSAPPGASSFGFALFIFSVAASKLDPRSSAPSRPTACGT